MLFALIFVGILAVGFVGARWWLLPIPLVAYGILNAVSPVQPDDDITGFGRGIALLVSTVLLFLAIAAGKLARQLRKPPHAR